MGIEGEFGVLKDYSLFMFIIKLGIFKVCNDVGGWDEYFVCGGFVDVVVGGLIVLVE